MQVGDHFRSRINWNNSITKGKTYTVISVGIWYKVICFIDDRDEQHWMSMHDAEKI